MIINPEDKEGVPLLFRVNPRVLCVLGKGYDVWQYYAEQDVFY